VSMPVFLSMTWRAILTWPYSGGVLQSFVVSPFELVKTRQQVRLGSVLKLFLYGLNCTASGLILELFICIDFPATSSTRRLDPWIMHNVASNICPFTALAAGKRRRDDCGGEGANNEAGVRGDDARPGRHLAARRRASR